MSMNTYPINEPAGLYIDETIAPYIILADDRLLNDIPESVQALLDTGCFDKAAKKEISLEDFVAAYPQYANLMELIPEHYRDADIVNEIIKDPDCIYCNEANVFIETYKSDKVKNPISKTLEDEMLVYLQPNRTMNYFEKAYESIDELMKEYKERLKNYIPEELDIRRYICSISGTYFC